MTPIQHPEISCNFVGNFTVLGNIVKNFAFFVI